MSACEKERLKKIDQCKDNAATRRRACIEEGVSTRRRCAERRVERTRECSERRTERNRVCREYGEETQRVCGDFHPLIAWLCVVWRTVTQIVCIAYGWVENTVCVAYREMENVTCLAWETVTRVFCRSYGWVASAGCRTAAETSYAACLIAQAIKAAVPSLGVLDRVILPFLPRGLFGAVSDFFEGIFDAIISGAAFLVEIFNSTVGVLLDAIAFVISIAFTIPVIGPALRIIVNAAKMLVFSVLGLLIELTPTLLGARPEKKLRVCVLLPEYMDTPTARTALIAQLQEAANLLWARARVRLLPARYFQVRRSGANAPETVTNDWITVCPFADPNHPEAWALVDVPCPGGANAAQEFGRYIFGGQGRVFGHLRIFLFLAQAGCLRGFYRGVIGPSPSVKVLVVEGHDGALGCALSGWMTLFATVNNPDPDPAVPGQNVHGNGLPRFDTTAHELGHVCSLWHEAPGINNLMSPNRTGNALEDWQVYILRSSRLVSYLG